MTANCQEKLNPALTDFKKFIEKSVATVTGVESGREYNVYDVKLGHWNITPGLVDEFLNLYDKVIKGGAVLNTFERSDNYRGLMIDLDIEQGYHSLLYTDEFFLDLALNYYAVIYDICGKGKINQKDRVIITRRAEITKKDGYYKDGCHIYFPSMRMSKALRVYILEQLKAATKGIISEMLLAVDIYQGAELMASYTDFDKWVDIHAAKVATMLPGSVKPHSEVGPHKVIHKGEITIRTRRSIPYPEFIEVDFENVAAACALVLEHSGYHCSEYRLEDESVLIKDTDLTRFEDEEELDEEITLDTMSMQNPEAAFIIKLLDILPSKYYEEYSHWFKVLCAISSFGTRFKSIGLWFSKKSKKNFSKESFEVTWESAIQGRKYGKKLTKRSIIYWARKENPEKFAEISNRSYITLLIDSIMASSGEFSHGTHAKILYSMISHKFVYSTKSDIIAGKTFAKCWYEFITDEDDHQFGQEYKWRADPEGTSIKKYITFNYPIALKDGMTFINENLDKVSEITEKEKFNMWSAIKRSFKKTIKDVGNMASVSRIINACELLFERREFMNELDKQEDLIGVANGVLKVGAKCKLIRRCHEHPVMLHTVASYTPYDETSLAVQKVLEIFRQVYPEPDVNEYIWTMAATGLDRRPITGKLLFIIGGGSNGKTVTMNFIQNALGLNLCASIKMELLTGANSNSSNADSSFMQAKGKTLLIIDEGSGNDSINSVKIKNLINSSVQSGRDLFERQSNFNIHANGFATTNHEPIIKSTDSDHGFWRRIWFYIAKSKFTSNPDVNRPNEFKADASLEYKATKDPLYLNAVLSIMTYYYEKFISNYNGRLDELPCSTLRQETDNYRKKQDKIFRYTYDNIICSPKSVVSTLDVGNSYALWARRNYDDNVMAFRAETLIANGILAIFKSDTQFQGIRVKVDKTDGPRRDLGEIPFSEFYLMSENERRGYLNNAAEIRKKILECDNDEIDDQ